MAINKEDSVRLNVMRFPLIVGVVFIHAYEISVATSSGVAGIVHPGAWASFVRDAVSMGLARIAVPAFFMISGYLFFAGGQWSAMIYADKLKARARTLLIPFLFWNILVLVLVALASSLPSTRQFFSGSNKWIAGFRLEDCVAAVFGIGRGPIAYQFWFLRDLMVLALLSPMIRLLVTRLGGFFVFALFLLWFFARWPGGMVPSVEAMLYFSVGCWFSESGKSVFLFDPYWKAVSSIYCIMLLLDVFAKGEGHIHRAALIFGVITAFSITRLALKFPPVTRALTRLAGASFFVFAAHEPLLTFTRKLLYKVTAPTTDGEVLLLYVTIPVMVVAILLITHELLRRWMPRFLDVITGMREQAPRESMLGVPMR